jgi:hypothetical protein
MSLPDDEWPYVCYTGANWPDVVAWCEQNIGVFDQEWYKLGEDPAAMMIYTDYKSTYMFRDERHAMLFKLKWT